MNTILTSEYYSSPDSGLVGYWRLDEGTGQTAPDLSSYSNNATLGTLANPDAGDPIWVEANILIVNVEEEKDKSSLPTEFSLSQNYPNPFNPATKIKFTIPSVETHRDASLLVTLKVFDILGSEIETLVNEEKPAGTYELTWNAEQLPSGVYFYQLRAGSFIETKKMLLLR